VQSVCWELGSQALKSVKYWYRSPHTRILPGYQAEKFEAHKMFSPSGFTTALFTGKILVFYDKIEPVSVYKIQVKI